MTYQKKNIEEFYEYKYIRIRLSLEIRDVMAITMGLIQVYNPLERQKFCLYKQSHDTFFRSWHLIEQKQWI
jgi:hypothetical protein